MGSGTAGGIFIDFFIVIVTVIDFVIDFVIVIVIVIVIVNIWGFYLPWALGHSGWDFD